MLHDGRLALTTWPDQRNHAFRTAVQRAIKQRQLGRATEEAIRLGGAMINTRRTHQTEEELPPRKTRKERKKDKKLIFLRKKFCRVFYLFLLCLFFVFFPFFPCFPW